LRRAQLIGCLAFGLTACGSSAASPVTVTPTAMPTVPVGMDPTIWRLRDEPDRWPLIAEVPDGEGEFADTLHNLRAGWEDVQFCWLWHMRTEQDQPAPDDSVGDCATWGQLYTVSEGGPVAQVHDVEFDLEEFHAVWVVLSADVARADVTLASGEVLEPSILEVASGPAGYVALMWTRTASPPTSVDAYDAAGTPVTEVACPAIDCPSG
jgi:hypothetical protein